MKLSDLPIFKQKLVMFTTTWARVTFLLLLWLIANGFVTYCIVDIRLDRLEEHVSRQDKRLDALNGVVSAHTGTVADGAVQ